MMFWVVMAGICASRVTGHSNIEESLGKWGEDVPPSDRGVARSPIIVFVAHSMNLRELKEMLGSDVSLSPKEVVYYCAFPALMYSVKKTNIAPRSRFEAFIERNYARPLTKERFFEQFCCGDPLADISHFSRHLSRNSQFQRETRLAPVVQPSF